MVAFLLHRWTLVFISFHHTWEIPCFTAVLKLKTKYPQNLTNFLRSYVCPIVGAYVAITSKSYRCSSYFKVACISHEIVKYSIYIILYAAWAPLPEVGWNGEIHRADRLTAICTPGRAAFFVLDTRPDIQQSPIIECLVDNAKRKELTSWYSILTGSQPSHAMRCSFGWQTWTYPSSPPKLSVGQRNYCTWRYCNLWIDSYSTNYTCKTCNFSSYEQWRLAVHKKGDYWISYRSS